MGEISPPTAADYAMANADRAYREAERARHIAERAAQRSICQICGAAVADDWTGPIDLPGEPL